MNVTEIRRKNLKELMAEKRLSPAGLAKLLSKSPNYIYELLAEPGKSQHRGIGHNTLKNLCKALQVPMERFHVGLAPPISGDGFVKLIIEYLPRLHEEDKKTILRDIIRYLNPPQIASKVISDLFKTPPEKK